MALPNIVDSVESLQALMTTPSLALIADLAAIPGDILILGVGGKMGPTLARLAKRAAPDKRVIGVARFSEPGLQHHLVEHGIECIVADLLDQAAVRALPRTANVIFMAGRKFGSSGREDLTWAMNAWVPAGVADTFGGSRIVAFSTACVYPFVSPQSGGALESSDLTPLGEYANSCVARERMFQYFSHRHQTPGRLIRLSYAIDMRYGVLHDIARAVLSNAPVDLSMGHVNIIWQGDANTQALRALAHCTTPTTGLNVSGAMQSVRALALQLGERLGKTPRFTGQESPTAWLVNCEESTRLFGPPEVPIERLLDWTAHWVAAGGVSHGKETHFSTRDGVY